MDSKKLPGRALVDTGLLTRAIGGLPADAQTALCREFYEQMLAEGRDVLIAAPTIAEIMRLDGKRTVPRVRNVEVVGFDEQAATLLGAAFPMSVLKKLAAAIGKTTTQTYLKYDAMIVACAMRHGAQCIVALDSDIHELGKEVGIDVYRPDHFLAPQVSLHFAAHAAPAPTEPETE